MANIEDLQDFESEYSTDDADIPSAKRFRGQSMDWIIEETFNNQDDANKFIQDENTWSLGKTT